MLVIFRFHLKKEMIKKIVKTILLPHFLPMELQPQEKNMKEIYTSTKNCKNHVDRKRTDLNF